MVIIESDFVDVLGDILHTWTNLRVTFSTSKSKMKNGQHLLLSVNFLKQHRINHVRQRSLFFKPFPHPPHQIRHLNNHRGRRGRAYRRRIRRFPGKKLHKHDTKRVHVPFLSGPASRETSLGSFVSVGSIGGFYGSVRENTA